MIPRELEALPLEHLEQEIGELAAHLNAATCRWLLLVAEFDRRSGWLVWGCRSCADWLSLRCGVALGSAREQVRVARRLCELPLVLEAFGQGRLSYSKVRAVTRVASADSEPELLELALHATAAQLERIVRSYRGVLAAQVEHANAVHAERYFSWSWDDDGSPVLSARLALEDGALVLAALEAGRDRLWSASAPAPEESSEGANSAGAGEGEKAAAGRANVDALAWVAEAALASPEAGRSGGDRYQLVVHTEADALAGGDGHSELEHGPR